MVLMHASSYPVLPEDSTSSFKEALRRTANESEERIRNSHGFGNETITIYKLISHPLTKTHEKTLKLPENTPEPLRKLFKSD